MKNLTDFFRSSAQNSIVISKRFKFNARNRLENTKWRNSTG